MTKRKRREDPQEFLDQLEAKRKPRRRWLRWGCGALLAVFVVCGAISFLILSDHDVRARVALTQTAIALLPTATRTPTPTSTHTPSATFTPSNTPRPSATPLPTSTPAPNFMATAEAQASAIAGTQFAALTPTIALTPIRAQMLYVQGDTRARSCPSRSCEVVGTYTYGDRVQVDSIAVGDSVSGSSQWFRTQWRDGRVVYIHSSLTMVSLPLPTSPPIQAFSALGNNSSATCPGFDYTCPMLTCSQARACLAAGNDQLDGNNDGIPCNAQCG